MLQKLGTNEKKTASSFFRYDIILPTEMPIKIYPYFFRYSFFALAYFWGEKVSLFWGKGNKIFFVSH